ncbi:MAG: mannose-6-phosphate isomerase, class I [Sphaerochaetaceae bacterium]|jgi:mannose-6-phosphate isomerase
MKRIEGVIKNYDWGNSYYIDDLLGHEPDGTPKAELWLGCHPSGPSTVCDTKETLAIKGFPFLFKVLAISKCLSLQVHPTLAQAASGRYQDLNQKAEVFCALTPVTALCGFRPLDEIRRNMAEIFGRDSALAKSSSIKGFFDLLYSSSEGLLPVYHAYLNSHSDVSCSDGFKSALQVAREVSSDYPCDPATLAPYFLNLVHLSPGQAIFLMPRVIHCYVFGNGVELMNSSDNVIRAGLTSKKVDRSELERVALFEHTPACSLAVQVCSEGAKYVIPDNPGFELFRLESGLFSASEPKYRIYLCTRGLAKLNGFALQCGQAMLTEPGESVIIDATAAQVFAAAGKGSAI